MKKSTFLTMVSPFTGLAYFLLLPLIGVVIIIFQIGRSTTKAIRASIREDIKKGESIRSI